MARLDQERQKELEPKRLEFAKEQIEKLGLELVNETDSRLDFKYKEQVVQFFPYSGWHTGKNIKDGRGWKKLYNQIKA